MADFIAAEVPGGVRCAERLRNFLYDCAASSPADEAERVREASQLLPAYAGSQAPEREAIEALLENGGGLSAVLAIIGSNVRFMLSRGEDGTCLATVLPLDGGEEMTEQGDTLGLALLAAHVSACLAGLERKLRAEIWSAPSAARLH